MGWLQFHGAKRVIKALKTSELTETPAGGFFLSAVVSTGEHLTPFVPFIATDVLLQREGGRLRRRPMAC